MIAPQAETILKEKFGYDHFRAGQNQAISRVLAGESTLVVMPTGGGKSLCYQIPAMLLSGLTLVVSPLIALMKDQVDALNDNGIPAAFINSTLDYQEIADRLDQARSGRIKLLYVAPERFDTDWCLCSGLAAPIFRYLQLMKPIVFLNGVTIFGRVI